MEVEKLFRNIPSDIRFENEAGYKLAWQKHVRSASTQNLFELAFQGGALADRLSFVFLGAYQAAVRHCFPSATGAGFYCFAASEDRSGKLPGTSVRDGVLFGSKTWIAASACVDEIIATVDHACLLVTANSPGVTLDNGEPMNFLPDLSQGKAHFDNARFEQIDMHGDFSLAEAFFVTCAATGFLAREAQAHGDDRHFETVIEHASTLSGLYSAGIDSNIDLLTATYHAVKDLGKQIAAETTAKDQKNDWAQNGRLLGMYGRRLPA